jgi:hypothetical protein
MKQTDIPQKNHLPHTEKKLYYYRHPWVGHVYLTEDDHQFVCCWHKEAIKYLGRPFPLSETKIQWIVGDPTLYYPIIPDLDLDQTWALCLEVSKPSGSWPSQWREQSFRRLLGPKKAAMTIKRSISFSECCMTVWRKLIKPRSR